MPAGLRGHWKTPGDELENCGVTDRRGCRVKSSLDTYWPRHDAGLPGRGERFRPEADCAYPAREDSVSGLAIQHHHFTVAVQRGWGRGWTFHLVGCRAERGRAAPEVVPSPSPHLFAIAKVRNICSNDDP